ncbi:16S rRNA (cytidine(1402)-2'-O)-methyltransferase [Nguyenibacter vanlangensis]
MSASFASSLPLPAVRNTEGLSSEHIASHSEPDPARHDLDDTIEDASMDQNGRVGQLILVSTPIGNLGDLSERAIVTLTHADLVLCEDTRVTARLLVARAISVRTEALHDHNERDRIPRLLELLKQGRRIAIVSDAGTPLLSDPGYRLVRAAIAEEIAVTAVPGPNAAITALTLSGLPPHPFFFGGFLPPKGAARRDVLGRLRAAEQAGFSATLIWHEAPHRLQAMLADLASTFGTDRPATVARELTKRFEEVRRGPVGTLATWYDENAARGEITVLLGPPPETDQGADDLDARLVAALESLSIKDAATLVATSINLPRRTVYTRALELASQNRRDKKPHRH